MAATKTAKPYLVRYIDNNGKTKEKGFADEDARAEWLDEQYAEHNIEVLAFSDPEM